MLAFLIMNWDNVSSFFSNNNNVIINTCTPIWTCAAWSNCSSGTMQRLCTDVNNCNSALNKPNTISSCVNNNVSSSLIPNANDSCNISCKLNIDCDDNNPQTTNECFNSGTCNSYCFFHDEFLYDDFSGSGLNNIKWQEIPGNGGYFSIHNVQNGVYYTKQNYEEDKGVILKLINFEIKPGNIIEYDVNYISGSGNRLIELRVDDNVGAVTCGIGYWNGGTIPNIFGAYHYKITYYDNYAFVEKTGTAIHNCTITNISEPFVFSIGSRTGGNGLLEVSYDSFKIK
jgi:hypothetical protein